MLEHQEQGVTPHLIFQVLDGAAGPRGNVTFLPGTWGHLGVPIWLGDGSLWEEDSGVCPLHLIRWCGVGPDSLLVKPSCLVSVLEMG